MHPQQLSKYLRQQLRQQRRPHAIPKQRPRQHNNIPPLRPPIKLTKLTIQRNRPSTTTPTTQQSNTKSHPLLTRRRTILHNKTTYNTNHIKEVQPTNNDIQIYINTTNPLTTTQRRKPMLIPLSLTTTTINNTLTLPLRPHTQRGTPQILTTNNHHLRNTLRIQI